MTDKVRTNRIAAARKVYNVLGDARAQAAKLQSDLRLDWEQENISDEVWEEYDEFLTHIEYAIDNLMEKGRKALRPR